MHGGCMRRENPCGIRQAVLEIETKKNITEF